MTPLGAVTLVYVAGTLIELRSAPAYQLANAGLLVAAWFCCLKGGKEASPSVGIAAGLALAIMAYVWTVVNTKVFGIPDMIGWVLAIAVGAIAVGFHLRRIIRGESG